MGATVLDGAIVGEGSIIGAGCLVTEGMRIPPRSLVLGLPGKIIRTLDESENPGRQIAEEYLKIAEDHRQNRYPPTLST